MRQDPVANVDSAEANDRGLVEVDALLLLLQPRVLDEMRSRFHRVFAVVVVFFCVFSKIFKTRSRFFLQKTTPIVPTQKYAMQSHISMLTDAYCNAVRCDEVSGRAMFWKLQECVQRVVFDKRQERDDTPTSLKWQADLFEKFVSSMANKTVIDLARSHTASTRSGSVPAEQRDERSPEAAEALILLSDDAASTVDSDVETTSHTGQCANPLVLFGSIECVREQLADADSEEANEAQLEEAPPPEDPARLPKRRCYAVFHMSDGSEERYYGDWHTSCYPGKDTVYFDDGEVHLLPREDIVFVPSNARKRSRAKAKPTVYREVVEKPRPVERERKRPRVSLEAPPTQHLCTWGCGQPSDHKGLCFALQASRLRCKAVATE